MTLLVPKRTSDFVCSSFSAYGDSTILDKDSPADARLLVQKAKEANTKDLHYSHYRLALWLSIAKRRWRYSYFDLAAVFRTQSIGERTLRYFLRNIKRILLEKYRIIHLPQQELLWIFVNALHCLSYSTMDINGESDADYIFHHTERPEIIAEAAAFLEIWRRYSTCSCPQDHRLSRKSSPADDDFCQL